MPRLIVRGLVKRFGGVRAVDGISFEVAEGEFVTLLGPSGCGKSTTLYAIAGLDRPTAGSIALDERVLFDAAAGIFVAAEARNCGLVFQSYALWPHMTVHENVAFPLKVRRLKSKAIAEQVGKFLALVEMQEYADRHPHELSGGQQQRVALARTLVYQPNLLLLGQRLSVAAGREVVPGRQVTVSVRPEAVHLVQAGDVGSAEVSLLRGRIVQREYLGPRYQYAVSIADRLFRFEAVETLGCADATVTVPAESCTVFTFNGTASGCEPPVRM